MRLPWRGREYERTCDDCGYTWRVPRKFGRRRVKSISGISVGGRRGAFDKAELNSEIQSSMALGEQAETFRECPKCGSVHHVQRLVRP